MDGFDSGLQRLQVTIIAHNIVGVAPPLVPAHLVRHDCFDCLSCEPTTLHDPRDLLCFIAIDHQHAPREFAISAGFN